MHAGKNINGKERRDVIFKAIEKNKAKTRMILWKT